MGPGSPPYHDLLQGVNTRMTLTMDYTDGMAALFKKISSKGCLWISNSPYASASDGYLVNGENENSVTHVIK
ncbi:MAG: hypothetical protein M3P08_06190 [Thermoproteota archaeon]|nr:hypothetical protein [Thermoproteota archaeon]